jgi:type IV pilus assembly protein PilN
MPRINLLPWREELRNQRRNQFFVALGGAALGAGLILLVSWFVFDNLIENQRDRNDFLQQEIAQLDKQIEEILELENSKARLLARMEIIEQLQRSRPGIVHVFDEMVRVMPEGVYLRTVKQTGRRIEMVGVAESNTRVSALMRNIDKSEWLDSPDLEVVEVKPIGGGRGQQGPKASEFTVFARTVAQTVEDGAEGEVQ